MSLTSQQERIGAIKRAFAQYYSQHIDKVVLPPDFQSREYGFLSLGEKMMIRHKAIKTREDLASLIQTIAPSDVYYSTAYYTKPMEQMEKKGWLGADLVFDIDADHIDTTCKIRHDTWKCMDCEQTGAGPPPAQCPNCGKTKFEAHTWFCDECLTAAKNEMFKLKSFLTDDFGIDDPDIHMFFSGHRGYHLHVRNADVRTLDEGQRKEIVDYVLGTGLDSSRQGIYKKPRDTIVGPQQEDAGWRGRLAKEIYRLITEGTEKDLMDLGLTTYRAKQILNERAQIKEDWREKILWGEFEDRFSIKDDTWRAMIDKAITTGALSAEIDTVVTTDIHRLIRLPETLNGKTGLRAATIPDLNTFDPFTDALAFDGETTIQITQTPAFRIADKTYGPYHEEKATLPTSAAILVLCKKLGAPYTVEKSGFLP